MTVLATLLSGDAPLSQCTRRSFSWHCDLQPGNPSYVHECAAGIPFLIATHSSSDETANHLAGLHMQDPVTQLPVIMASATDRTALASLRCQLEDVLEHETK